MLQQHHPQKPRVFVVLGTRPEAIKLCPLIQALQQKSQWETLVCVTAQHRAMLDQVLSAFAVKPDFDLDLMQPGQTLPMLTARILQGLEPILQRERPSLVVVQGDTTTTLAAALGAFYAHIPVAHVEAGLRTFDLDSPFPEEMNRLVTGRLSTLHFAATESAARNLRAEGVAASQIEVTGNTGIDSILAVRANLEAGRLLNTLPFPIDKRKIILVTAHRRESFGDALANICRAIAELSRRPDVQIVWPLHPNPQVQETAGRLLRGQKNVRLIAPLDYVPFVDLMRHAHLLITDSGGIQEEGPSLGKPVLVLREKTERPEAVEEGTVKLVGTEQSTIVQEAVRLLDDTAEYARRARRHNPYGDGQASARIVRRLEQFFAAPHSQAKSHSV